MCTAVEEQLIQAKVDDFVAKDEAFTSVDIANAIKTDGTWIRNREVAVWLRNNFSADSYEKDMIDVGGGHQAFLYRPDFFDSDNYDGKNQKAMNPDDYKTLHPDDDAALVAGTTNLDPITDTDEEEDFDEDSRTVTVSLGRIWVPATIIVKLGMSQGDEVDNDKLGITGDPSLTVHHDGRVSVNSSYINSGSFVDSNKIVISIKGGKAVFEKA